MAHWFIALVVGTVWPWLLLLLQGLQSRILTSAVAPSSSLLTAILALLVTERAQQLVDHGSALFGELLDFLILHAL